MLGQPMQRMADHGRAATVFLPPTRLNCLRQADAVLPPAVKLAHKNLQTILPNRGDRLRPRLLDWVRKPRHRRPPEVYSPAYEATWWVGNNAKLFFRSGPCLYGKAGTARVFASRVSVDEHGGLNRAVSAAGRLASRSIPATMIEYWEEFLDPATAKRNTPWISSAHRATPLGIPGCLTAIFLGTPSARRLHHTSAGYLIGPPSVD